MSPTSSDSERYDGETAPSAEEKSNATPSAIPSELQRQMEAARERMQKYHAVYKQLSEKPGS